MRAGRGPPVPQVGHHGRVPRAAERREEPVGKGWQLVRTIGHIPGSTRKWIWTPAERGGPPRGPRRRGRPSPKPLLKSESEARHEQVRSVQLAASSTSQERRSAEPVRDRGRRSRTASPAASGVSQERRTAESRKQDDRPPLVRPAWRKDTRGEQEAEMPEVSGGPQAPPSPPSLLSDDSVRQGQGGVIVGTLKQAKKDRACFQCGQTGHFSKNCPTRPRGDQERQCRYCQEFGHIPLDCTGAGIPRQDQRVEEGIWAALQGRKGGQITRRDSGLGTDGPENEA